MKSTITNSGLLIILIALFFSCNANHQKMHKKTTTKKSQKNTIKDSVPIVYDYSKIKLEEGFSIEAIDTIPVKKGDTVLFRKWGTTHKPPIYIKNKTSKFKVQRAEDVFYYKTGVNKFSTYKFYIENANTKKKYHFYTYMNHGTGTNPYNMNKTSNYFELEKFSDTIGRFNIGAASRDNYFYFKINKNNLNITKLEFIPRVNEEEYSYVLDTLIVVNSKNNSINIGQLNDILLSEKKNIMYKNSYTISDANFLQALLDEGVDSNNDGKIQDFEAERIECLEISNKGINDLSGIEYFTALFYLDCSNNNLVSLNLSHNTSLGYIDCSDNNLSSLNLSTNTQLVTLLCANTSIRNYKDIIGINKDIWQLALNGNGLTSIDVSNYSKLTNLMISDNKITTIDLRKNTRLWRLVVSNTNITKLDLSNNPKLEALYCKDNSKLNYVNLQNGNNNLITTSDFQNTPNLDIICLDKKESALRTRIDKSIGHTVIYKDDCDKY